MVLANHQFFSFSKHLVIVLHRFLITHVHAIRKTFPFLNNSGYTVIDDRAQVAFYIVAHQTNARFLALTDVTRLDIQLVSNAMQTEYTP